MNKLSSQVYQNAFIALKNGLISNLGLYEFRQLTYKETIFGTVVELVDRWFPSPSDLFGLRTYSVDEARAIGYSVVKGVGRFCVAISTPH